MKQPFPPLRGERRGKAFELSGGVLFCFPWAAPPIWDLKGFNSVFVSGSKRGEGGAGDSTSCSRCLREKQKSNPAGGRSRSAKLVWLWWNFNLSVVLIVPGSKPILGCLDTRCREDFSSSGVKKKITKRLFKCANKFMTLFSFFISHISFIPSIDSNFVSSYEPKDIKPHYTVTVCCMRWEGGGYHRIRLFIQTGSGWTMWSAELPAVAGRNCFSSTVGEGGKPASAMPLVYLKVKIVFVLTIRTTHLLPRPHGVCASEGRT